MSGRLRDRETWPAGPWDDEPDRMEWYHGDIPCLALRGPMGAWCGYAAVPPGHPWHGADYDSVDVDVHGGLTFAAPCQVEDAPAEELICHVPRPGESDDVWWLGFDCGHAFDIVPRMLAIDAQIGYPFTSTPALANWPSTYKPLGYVRGHVEALAAAIEAAA